MVVKLTLYKIHLNTGSEFFDAVSRRPDGSPSQQTRRALRGAAGFQHPLSLLPKKFFHCWREAEKLHKCRKPIDGIPRKRYDVINDV